MNAKRFIVHESVAEEFSRAFSAGIRALKVGDPVNPETQIGPMVRMNLRAELHDQVRRSVSEGATLALGGQPLDRPGCYCAPTLGQESGIGQSGAGRRSVRPNGALASR